MQYALLVCGVVGLTIIYGRIVLRRRREAPLRREIRAQSITFRTELGHVKTMTSRGWWTGPYGLIELIVRTDGFEVSSAIPPVRVALGLEYYFRACDTTIEVSQLPSGVYKRDWIVIKGQQLDKEVQLAIAQKSSLHEAWNALARAGAVPIGPPPGDLSVRA